MTFSPTQVRFLVLMACLLVPAIKAEARTETPAASGYTAAEPLSLGDLMDGIGDWLPDRVESTDKIETESLQPAKPEPKLEPKPASPAASPAAPPAPAPTAPAAPATYRVYPSPYVPDEPQSATAQFSDMPVIRSMTRQTEEEPQASIDLPPPVIDMPDTPQTASPVAGIGHSYFPMLPLGAASDERPQLLPLSSNHALADDHSTVTRAVIFIHDLTRNASEGLSMLTTLAGADDGAALIIAPQFPLEIDIARFAARLPDQGKYMARWPLGASNGWQTGGDSITSPPQKGISSFTAIDLLLLYLADRRTFPALQQVTIAGHGMGADFAQRYAAIGQSPSLLAKQNLPVRFLAANPSSYLYFTAQRPSANGPNFILPNTEACPIANSYPYGLDNLVPYARRIGSNAIRLRYPERSVTVLLSDKIASDPYLDTICAASIQGKDRLTRGRSYERYLALSFGDSTATHRFSIVPNAGYDPVTLLGSYCGLSLLFGDGECRSSR